MDLKFSLPLLIVFTFFAFFVGTFHASPLDVNTAKAVSETRLRRQDFRLEDSDKGKKCNNSIMAKSGDEGDIWNYAPEGKNCYYSILAPPGHTVQLKLKMLEFGASKCEEERVVIRDGVSTHGKTLWTICGGEVPEKEEKRANKVFIEYHNPLGNEGDRFHIKYSVVIDNFTPAPTTTPKPSPVGGNDSCSGIWSDINEGFTGHILYTAPTYEENRHCVLVVRTATHNHVVQAHFNRFEMEDSDNCEFDSLNIFTGERADSASLGGPYCANSLNGRTLLSSGNTMRLVFKTDQSLSFFGFQAKFTFVHMDNLEKDCGCSIREVCVVQGFEKMCIAGSQCSVARCENGATCVNNGSVDHCYCTAGYTGKLCNERTGSAGRLKFKKGVPQSRKITKGGQAECLCQVEKPASGERVVYSWYHEGKLIGDYHASSKFGDMGEGLLWIHDFDEHFEGRYTCEARAGNSTAKHTFTLKMIDECRLEMKGPSDVTEDADKIVILSCSALGAADIWWEKGDGKINTESTGGKFSKMENKYLRIASVSTQDSGEYTCVAKDIWGCESRRKGTLTILNREKYEQSNCGGEFNADRGVIQLPTTIITGKELYEANTVCKWKIKVPDGHHVVINSEHFDLEASTNCQHDYVLVEDGSRNNKFCGKKHLVYVSISNNLTVTFTCDDSVSGRGFKLNVTTVPNSTEGKCNSTILAIQGQDGDIWNYDKPGNCFYSLEAPEGLTVQITLQFINFGSNLSDEKRIVIRDGVSTHGEHLWNISSGEPLRKKSVCAKQLFIEYHNQGCTKAVRFYLTYSVLTCTAEPTTYPPTSFSKGDNECGCKEHAVCVLQGFEKMCIPGSQCAVDLCKNGATCVNTSRGDQCFCSGGFIGKFCTKTAGSTLGHLKFIEVPQSRKVKPGGQSVSLCRVSSGERVVYSWYFEDVPIGIYQDRTELRDDEGLLLINAFNEGFEGRYTCVARAGTLTTKHTITLSMDECFLGIKGPTDAVDYPGRTVTLSCSTEEAGDIWWEKDNVKIDGGGKFHISQNKTIYHLRIDILEEQDSDVYTCVARDTTGCTKRRSAKVTVQNWAKHETYCGKSYRDQINADRAKNYISMGSDALQNENPWHVSLFNKSTNRPFCGGSLISQRFVVTAAHCITDGWRTEGLFKEYVLIEFASLSCTLDGLHRRFVKSVTIHPNYNKTQFDSDIALLELRNYAALRTKR